MIGLYELFSVPSVVYEFPSVCKYSTFYYIDSNSYLTLALINFLLLTYFLSFLFSFLPPTKTMRQLFSLFYVCLSTLCSYLLVSPNNQHWTVPFTAGYTMELMNIHSTSCSSKCWVIRNTVLILKWFIVKEKRQWNKNRVIEP